MIFGDTARKEVNNGLKVLKGKTKFLFWLCVIEMGKFRETGQSFSLDKQKKGHTSKNLNAEQE